ncbi:hypothetical protein EDI_276400 [Entamoeba dispar SAW760]|uniref:Uncharacterized protein n=1 Tax=Entamoeba dispar (strain ATCC PRA-260 / SAW760) TaxID=370354 RepID=B0EDR6_ENTDS|nr:uncharacterized protein EDI_276400 [Entamoeba dispar SAW760]EDR27329.1 hypothetical protein EDI_276400 [Entamoeba dispar SAW760]|eukprot:EDR27329.1 hypothetical protein EDI_276400 [Entamoeba dispar SAW760]
MSCEKAFGITIIGCLLSVLIAFIAAGFVLSFSIPSYVYSKDLERLVTCDTDGVLEGWKFSYKSGYYFGLLNIIFVSVSFGIAVLSFIPVVGLFDFILGLITSCGSVAFFIIGIIVLAKGLSVSINELDEEKKICFENQNRCCLDVFNCSECTYTDETGQLQQCSDDCNEAVVNPAEHSVRVIGSMLIVGSGMMGWYIVTGIFTLVAAFGFCAFCCDEF